MNAMQCDTVGIPHEQTH